MKASKREIEKKKSENATRNQQEKYKIDEVITIIYFPLSEPV